MARLLDGSQTQLIPIPFTGGIDTKTDPHQVLAGNLLTLQNGQFSQKGQINKRYGYDVLGTNIEGGGTILAGAALATYNDELLAFDGTYIYSYMKATGTWLNRGVAVSVIAQSDVIIRTNTDQQLNPDVGVMNGVQVYAWESATGGIKYSASDLNTGAQSAVDQVVYSLGHKPKVIGFNNLVYVFYTDGVNNIFYKTVNPFNPTQLSTATLVVSDGYSNNVGYDVAVIGNQMFVAYLSSGAPAGQVNVLYYDQAMVQSNIIPVDNVNAIVDGYNSVVNVTGDSNNNAWISWGTGEAVFTACKSYTLTDVLPPTFVDGYTTQIETLTGIESTTPGILQLTWEVFNTEPHNESVVTCTVSSTGVVGTKSTVRSVGLASKAFKVNNNIFVNVAYQSPLTNGNPLQNSYFTLMLQPSISVIAKLQPGLGGGLRTNNMLSEAPMSATNTILWANSIKDSLTSEGQTIFSLLGVGSTTLDFQHPNRFISAEANNNLLFVGGILNSYDGVSVVEQGYHIYPEGFTAVASGADGFLSSGTYQYVVVYEWTDNLGQVQRSADSVPVTVTVTANNHVLLTIPTLRLTSKVDPRTPVSIAIYRTQANGSSFNRVSSTIAPLSNDPTVDSVQFVDVLSDVDAASGELLYTSGGVLSNMSPPANSLLCTYQNRVFVGGLEDPNELWYSKNRFNNTQTNATPIEFASEQTIGVDPRGGPITALALIGTNLIIFKERAIFLLNGDGPNDTGQGDVFPDPVMIVSDVGCNNPNSVVIVNDGIMFQSEKGIYHLGSDCATLNYIGAPVEAFNSYTITSSAMISNCNQVVFTTSTGPSLVYDYFFGQWSTWTNQASEDCLIYNGNFTFIKPNGMVWTQNQSLFTDNNAPVYMSWTTPNLNFNDLQGLVIVFRCLLLGTYKGPHNLIVKVAYDNNPTYTETCTINASTNISNWGSDSTWGSGSLWGGAYVPYEFEINFAQQVCTSIRLEVSDNQSSNYNEGYAISALTFEVGALPRGNRLPASAQYGSQ